MIAQVVPVLLALGGNLGDREATIRSAVADLAALDGLADVVLSPIRETIAFGLDGPDPCAPKYLNAVVTATTTIDPHDLLDRTQEIEQRHGRVRAERWGDRTLDIDLILYGGRVIRDDRLTVPHPRAHKRDFVLAPWFALDPNAVLMGHGRVQDLLARIGDTTTAYIPEAESGQARRS